MPGEVGQSMPIRALAVSDQVDPRIYSSSIKERMGGVQIVFGCGDLPASYLEFLADALDRPVYFVFGNHLEEATREPGGKLYQPMGCVDLGGKVVRDDWTGLILAGIPGAPKYGDGEPLQFTEWQIWMMILRMLPRLLWNRLRHGRALDLLITHSPPRDLGDRNDRPHRGFKAIRHLLQRWRPRYSTRAGSSVSSLFGYHPRHDYASPLPPVALRRPARARRLHAGRMPAGAASRPCGAGDRAG